MAHAFPAVSALGLQPTSGPGPLFSTLPGVFAALPVGWLFGLLFFVGLFGAAYLSDVAAFEVLVAGITDNTGISRPRAVWLMAVVVFIFAIPPMINTEIFIPWDLTFGSGMQTLGVLLAVITVGWAMDRSRALAALGANTHRLSVSLLFCWIRLVIPAVIIAIGCWWLLTAVLRIMGPT